MTFNFFLKPPTNQPTNQTKYDQMISNTGSKKDFFAATLQQWTVSGAVGGCSPDCHCNWAALDPAPWKGQNQSHIAPLVQRRELHDPELFSYLNHNSSWTNTSNRPHRNHQKTLGKTIRKQFWCYFFLAFSSCCVISRGPHATAKGNLNADDCLDADSSLELVQAAVGTPKFA